MLLHSESRVQKNMSREIVHCEKPVLDMIVG